MWGKVGVKWGRFAKGSILMGRNPNAYLYQVGEIFVRKLALFMNHEQVPLCVYGENSYTHVSGNPRAKPRFWKGPWLPSFARSVFVSESLKLNLIGPPGAMR
jgi:hypothetical protein